MKTYDLRDYAERLADAGLLVSANLPERPLPIRYLTYDSRDLGEDTLFVCKGAAFKPVYLEDVVRRGIQGYVSEQDFSAIAPDTPSLRVCDIRRAMPYLGGLFYGDAWKELATVGITGTKGKSTTTYYVKYILDRWLASGHKPQSAIIGGIDNYDGVIFEESHLTTPEAIDLHRHFRNAVDSGISCLEMEVSSQGLKYNRVDGITFDVGMFLNISEDHISPLEHPTMEDYFQSKLRIFDHARCGVVNLDSDRADEVVAAAQKCERVLTFSLKRPDADIYGYDVRKEAGEIRFSVRTKDFDLPFALTMPGLFNVENALAAIAAAIALGVPTQFMQEGLYAARSSGRMEVYTSQDQKVVCIVDYAHNKLSFEKLFSSTKQEYPGYQIISIFGCPGLKALLRREALGTIAGQYAAKVYIVAEDPGMEPFMDISLDIARYVERTGCPYEIIEERGEAIRKAVLSAETPTVLLITGKGNETRQKYGSQYLPCKSDVELTKEALAEYDAQHR